MPVAPWSLALPAGADVQGARTAVEAVCAEVRRRGLGEPRVRGFGAPRFPRADFYAHLLGGALSWALGLFFPLFGLLGALGAVGSVMAVRFGWHGLARFPRVPGWSVVLRPAGPHTRHVVAGALDRAAPLRFEAEIVAAALAVVVLQFGLGAAWWLGPAALAAGALGVYVSTRVGVVGDPVATVGAVLGAAERLGTRADVAMVLCTGTAEAGAGVRAFVDWWALEGVDILLVGSPVAREGLGQLRVTEVAADVDAILARLG